MQIVLYKFSFFLAIKDYSLILLEIDIRYQNIYFFLTIMVFAVCDRVVVTQDVPKIKVLSGQSISLESKGTDSSLRLTFLVSSANYPLMFYFLRFFRGGTSHRVAGNVGV